MNDPIRFVLKDEDRAPTDPQQTGVDLMEQLRTLAEDAVYLRGLLTRVGLDPITTHSKAAHQAVDLAETANRALDAGETLMQALRSARLFSDAYEGVRDQRHA